MPAKPVLSENDKKSIRNRLESLCEQCWIEQGYKFRNYNWYDEEEDWYYGLDTMRVYKLDNNGGRKYLSDFGNEYSYEDLQKGEVRYIEVANLDTKYPET